MVAPNYRCSFNGVPEGGNIDGSSTSSGSGSAISAGSTSRATALAASAIRGSKGARVNATGVDQWLYWVFADASAVSLQIYIRIAAADLPTASQDFMQIRDASGRRVSCRFTTTGVLQAHDADGTARWTTTTKPADGDYVLTLQAYRGTSAADGKLAVTLRAVGDDSVQSSTPAGGTVVGTINTGGANTPYTSVRLLKTSSTGNWTLTADEPAVAYSGSATDLLGEIDRVSAAAAPGADAGEPQTVRPWSTVTLNGTESEGAIDTWTWTQTAGTSVGALANSAQPTFTAPATVAGETLTFSLTTSAGGVPSTGSSTVDITVLPPEWLATKAGALVPLRLMGEL